MAPLDPKDADLISKCLRQNASAQRQLYDCYFNYAMAIALRYCERREEAIEVVNDAFLKVFSNLKTYDTAYPFKSWFRQILVNTAVDHYRKNQRKIPSSAHMHVEGSQDPEIFGKLTAGEIMHCVQQLSPAYRIVFVLYAVEGYKHHEIAGMLGISEGTSKSNLATARSKLKEALSAIYNRNHPQYAR